MSPADPENDRPAATGAHEQTRTPSDAGAADGAGGTPAGPPGLSEPGPPAPAAAVPPVTPGLPGPGPVPAPPAGSTPRRPGRALVTVAATAGLIGLLGVPLGLLWRVLAPSIPVVRTEDGAVLSEPQPEQFIAADGWFSLLSVAFGALVAIGVWLLLRRWRGPLGMVAVAIGGIAAAVLAWQLGRRIGLADYHRLLESAPLGQIFDKPPDLRAGGVDWLFGVLPVIRGDLLLPAFAGVVVYTLLAGWSTYPGLRPEAEPVPAFPPGPYPPGPYLPEPDAGSLPAGPGSESGPTAGASGTAVSSDSPAPPAPPAEPAPPGPDAAAPPRG
ncbi:MAG TPA: DUF2567 domain-containing protein [Micromonospora sp.]